MYRKAGKNLITNTIAAVAISVSLILLLLMGGCAHSTGGAHGFTHLLGNSDGVYGHMSTRRTSNTDSMCFNGLLREWERLGCNQVGYQWLEDGYWKHWCADENAANDPNPVLSWDYFVILWNSDLNQYSRSMPDNTEPVCGDPSAIIVSCERD